MNALRWLHESFSLRLVETLGHSLWQGAAIGIVALTLDWLLRRASSQARYLVQVGAMAAIACCLPVTFCLLGTESHNLPKIDAGRSDLGDGSALARAEAVGVVRGIRTPFGVPPDVAARKARATAEGITAGLDEPVVSAGIFAETRSASAFEGAEGEPPAQPASKLLAFVPLVAACYLTGVLVLMVRLAIGIWGGQRLCGSAEAVSDVELLARMSRQAKRIGLQVMPALGYCESISVPIVVGMVRPMILLPISVSSGLSPDQLDVLITHELAHLRRYDPLVNFLQRFVEAVLFFHPAVWYVSRRISTEREHATDDMVLSVGWHRVCYADALVRMAELSAMLRSSPLGSRGGVLAAAGDRPSDLKRRVVRLLDTEPSHFGLGRAAVVGSLIVVTAAMVGPLMVRSWPRAASADGQESAITAQRGERLGRRIENFQLQDYLGAKHSLSDFADREIVVVAFLGTECPVAKLYGSRLATLADGQKTRSVAFIGILSNQQDTPTEIGHFARRHGISFPLLKDPANRVADQFQAERTPEVFVLDKSRNVRYWGRIDDQFGVGYVRPEPKEEYLVAAIEDLSAGRSVARPQTESVGCHIGRVSRVAPTGEVTYAHQISRIIQNRCIECHRDGGIAPFSMGSYDAVAAWAETIREVIADRRMPPWHASPKYGHFLNDGRMPEAEKELIYQWVSNGLPRGDVSALPPAPEFFDGWALGKPDLILTIPEPITVAPNGVVDYQYVTIDPGFTEGKWVRASEIRPGVRSVVHHIIVFINPPGGDPILEERGVGFETLGGYVPGSPPMQLGEGVARYVPAGSTLVFQIHYTPDGTQREDQSSIGLYFADPRTIRRTMQTGVAANLDLTIPPHAGHHRVEASHRFSHDMEIYSLAPHMHYRGKSFRFEVAYPNGSREVLLDVPRYDFNWQNVYKLVQPKFIPEGAILRCVAHFDNSDTNLSNPDPSKTIRWGEQTWDEMMIGYFEGVFLNQDLSLPGPSLTPTGEGNFRAHFVYRPDRPVKTVHLAGTFNDWSTQTHLFVDEDGDGVYSAEAIVTPGEHRYKFVVDGNYWTHDPASRILTGFLHESFFAADPEIVGKASK